MAEEKNPEKTATLPEPEGDDTDGSASVPGFVYLIHEKSRNFFKIGRAVDPDKRLADFQTAQPRKLEMKSKAWVSNMAQAEACLKEVMKKHYSGTDGGTEWFRGDVAEAEKLFKSTVKGR